MARLPLLLRWAPAILALAVSLPTPLHAQLGAREAAPPTAYPDIARADSLYQLGELEAALRILVPEDADRYPPTPPRWDRLGEVRSGTDAAEVVAELRGRGGGTPEAGGRDDPALTFERKWRASRIALGLGLMSEDWETRARRHRWGIVWGLEAATAEERIVGGGRGTEALYWVAANTGRYALANPSPQERARGGDAAYRLANTILERDPEHAGAHNVIGRSHLEVRSLGFAMRTLARAFMGGEFVSRSNWEAAERHLRRAVELDPGMLYYRLDLGLLHRARGDREGARSELERILALPARHPIDTWLHAEGRRELGGRE